MNQNLVKSLINIVGPNNILHSGAEKNRFTHIWKTDIPLEALAVVYPKTTCLIDNLAYLGIKF